LLLASTSIGTTTLEEEEEEGTKGSLAGGTVCLGAVEAGDWVEDELECLPGRDGIKNLALC